MSSQPVAIAAQLYSLGLNLSNAGSLSWAYQLGVSYHRAPGYFFWRSVVRGFAYDNEWEPGGKRWPGVRRRAAAGLVHILYNGRTLCGMVPGGQFCWPVGTLWVTIQERDHADCPECCEIHDTPDTPGECAMA